MNPNELVNSTNKINPQTMVIDKYAMFTLIMKSRFPSCDAEFMEWIMNVYMKSIFHTATQVPEVAEPTIVSIGPYKHSNCVYLYHLSRYDEPPYSFYKFGYSIGDIETRDSSHRRSFGYDIVLAHLEVSANPQDLESDFKRYARQNKSLVSLIDRKNKKQTEIVKSDKPINFWITAMQKLNINYVSSSNEQNNELEKSRQDHEYRMKELDIELELKKLEIQLNHEYRMKQLECEK